MISDSTLRSWEASSRVLSLRDVFTVLFKHQNVILTVFIVTLGLTAFVTLVQAPVYEAYSSVLIKIGREHIYRSEVGQSNPTISIDRAATINSEIRIASSADLIKKVLEYLTVETVYPDLSRQTSTPGRTLEEAIMKFQYHLSVSQAKDSNVLEITWQHEDPIIAAKAVNLLVEFLKEKHLRIYSDPNTGFLEKQVQFYKQKFDKSKADLETFKRTGGLSSLEDERRLFLEQIKEMDTTLKTVQHDIQGQRSKLRSLKTQKGSMPTSISLSSVNQGNTSIDKAKSELLDLRRREQELLAKYKERSRYVKEVREEIAIISQFIQLEEGRHSDRITKGNNPIFQQLEMEIVAGEANLQSLFSKEQEITRQLMELRYKLRNLESQEQELEALDLNLAMDRKNYETYLYKWEEARVSEEMDRLNLANMSVIQAAMVPLHPVKPQKILYVFLGALAGLVGGVGFGFVVEFLEGGYTRPEYLTRDLGLPILARIIQKA